MTVQEIELTDPEVLRDPFTAYGRLRERAPLARIGGPGFGPMWMVTRYADVKAMLSDARFEIRAESFQLRDVPEDCQPYIRTMTERGGQEHARLRGLVSPAFTTRRAAEFRPRIEPIVDRLADDLNGEVDLMDHFTGPLPMEVICELVGVEEADRPRWHEYGAIVAARRGGAFADAIPGIIAGAKEVVARRREQPRDDLLSDLITAQDGDRLTDAELVTLVWHLVLAGQTPTNLIANALAELLAQPSLAELLRAEPELMPRAVEELTRWTGPTLLTVPRYAREDVDLHGTLVRQGEPITASIAAANRDPRAFTDPDVLDLRREPASGHLGYSHGPHFCLGAAPARVQTEVALGVLLRRFPDMTLAGEPERLPDPGTWRLRSLVVRP
ncbi:cytochrome P450 [Herbihabitans rhizosphaerae]|uniref:Cytochrome P450 n=1 Tax=Herbihabitans rhizosphaerae TaxID=1872711 RepID=A0A4Q7KXL3_9PSEU|nr:cytochrome P450 [Herbihabitans rhizosphaerae]RZS40741.1 cytochrome P450 [Herbihabitans rhizosphaerae]